MGAAVATQRDRPHRLTIPLSLLGLAYRASQYDCGAVWKGWVGGKVPHQQNNIKLKVKLISFGFLYFMLN
jgi:hypothetical protein